MNHSTAGLTIFHQRSRNTLYEVSQFLRCESFNIRAIKSVAIVPLRTAVPSSTNEPVSNPPFHSAQRSALNPDPFYPNPFHPIPFSPPFALLTVLGD
jgi:hypothetical protein